jgi:hypothetical protein
MTALSTIYPANSSAFVYSANTFDTGTVTVDTFADTQVDGCQWFFSVKKGANLRTGIMMAAWDATGDTIDYTESATNDVGDTSDLTLAVDISSNAVRLRATAASDGWSVRVQRLEMRSSNVILNAELASSAQTVTGTLETVANTPGGLTARLAAPGAIGGTTPAAGAFTTLNSTAGVIIDYVGVSDANRTNTTLSTDHVIIFTSLTADRTYQISSEDIAQAGRVIVVKDGSGNAATFNIIISTEGAETIDGAATFTISSNYGAINLVSNGSNLFVY